MRSLLYKMSRRLPILVLVALASSSLGGTHRVDAEPRSRGHRVVGRCTPAHIQDIRLPFPVSVDEVRVVVADHSPAAGAATVRVDAGPFDRVLRVRGALSQGIKFEPALAGRVFHVSLDPVFEAPTSACIERVELRRDGVALAVVEP